MAISSKALYAVAAAAVVGTVAASCDQAYQCQYTYTNLALNKQYKFDFSSLCDANGGNDFSVNDDQGHTYYAKICGTAAQNCLPASWTNTYEYGVAVQNWGAKPTCDTANPACTEKTAGGGTKKVCCTKDCQVLGTGVPQWSLLDSSNPETGGIIAAYKGAAASDSDPFWCDFNPSTGSQYEREVHMIFQCDSSVDTVQVVKAVQNGTNDCRYKIYFNTQWACAGAGSGMSGGWVFIIVLFVLFVVYVIVGALITYSQERVWTFPHKAFWSDFFGMVNDGVRFTMSGFKKGGSGTSYSDVGSAPASGDVASSGYQGNSGKETSYTDL